jgi:polyphosphate kinase
MTKEFTLKDQTFSPEEMYLNREISDLALIDRVEGEVSNTAKPVLERLKFLAISSSLVDEFYRIRVTGLRAQLESGHDKLSLDGKEPLEQLAIVDERANEVAHGLQTCWLNLSKDLTKKGIEFLDPATLNEGEEDWLRDHFESHIFPALTPVTINPQMPFPFVADGKIFMVIKLKVKKSKEKRKAIITLPSGINRFIPIPSKKGKSKYRFITLEDCIIHFMDYVFAGLKVKDIGLARIIREGDLKVDDDAEDLIKSVEEALEKRTTANVVRLEITHETSEKMTRYIAECFNLIRDDDGDSINDNDLFNLEEDSVNDSAYVEPGVVLGLVDFMGLLGKFGSDCDGLRYPEFSPKPVKLFEEGKYFSTIKKQDVLLHWPFEPFTTVVNFLATAIDDDKVVAIKQTLYRAGNNSPVVAQLIKAANAGKAVTVIVELGARDDENENISLARRLEQAGAQVIYGFKGKKVHAKMLMVLRQEKEGLVPYVHVSTGNYHARSAANYCDVSLFSANPDLTSDVVHLFHYLSGDAPFKAMNMLSVAPINMRTDMIDLVKHETKRAKAGETAALWIKINRITDPKLIKALYKASAAGVKVELFVRGICCLKPGVKGLSENITVKSIIGRFLEHARILCIGNGKSLPSDTAQVFLSSADWMPHKMDQRVEVLFPILDAKIRKTLLEEIMAGNKRDDAGAWNLGSDGVWTKATIQENFSIQQYFLDQFSQ